MKYTTLNNGLKMPLIGFGVYQITNSTEAIESVKSAIRHGYTLIDTAAAYQNEKKWVKPSNPQMLIEKIYLLRQNYGYKM